MEFEWIPGQGIDLAAIERMKQHFPQPTKPSYEAWFISGEINYHHWLFKPIEELSLSDLADYLEDTGGGIMNFGQREEWTLWFQYLLPQFLPYFLHNDLFELMVNYIFNLYPDGIVEEYRGFRDDLLRTLPQAIMSADLWQGDDLAKVPYLYNEQRGYDPNNICCTLFFCLRYLTPDEIGTWVASIARINGELWCSEFAMWLRGAQRFFDYVEHPETIPEFRRNEYLQRRYNRPDTVSWFLGAAGIDWSTSYLVFEGLYAGKQLSDYLSAENMDTFWNEVRKYPALQAALE